MALKVNPIPFFLAGRVPVRLCGPIAPVTGRGRLAYGKVGPAVDVQADEDPLRPGEFLTGRERAG